MSNENKIRKEISKYWSKIRNIKWNTKNKIVFCITLIIIGYVILYYFGSDLFFMLSIWISIGVIFIPLFIRKIKEGSKNNQNIPVEKNNDNKNGQLICPKCGSNNIFISKRGFNASDACCGALLVGPLGLLCGQSGANQIEKNCLNCGKKF